MDSLTLEVSFYKVDLMLYFPEANSELSIQPKRDIAMAIRNELCAIEAFVVKICFIELFYGIYLGM